VRGLVKQQIDSFNFFLEESMRAIVMAEGNRRLTCDADVDWFLQYSDVRVGRPTHNVNYVEKTLTPHECRLRDMTYSAPITVCSVTVECCFTVVSSLFGTPDIYQQGGTVNFIVLAAHWDEDSSVFETDMSEPVCLSNGNVALLSCSSRARKERACIRHRGDM
jgi:hypothetical protein